MTKPELISTLLLSYLGADANEAEISKLRDELNGYDEVQLQIWYDQEQRKVTEARRLQADGFSIGVSYTYQSSVHPCDETLYVALKGMFLPLITAKEPDWVEATIHFDPTTGALQNAKFNGPLHGTTNCTEALSELVPAELYHEPVRMSTIGLYNRNDKVKLIPDRTILRFENGEAGFVSEVNGDTFIVTYHEHFGPNREVRTRTYTRAKLCDELTSQEMRYGQAVGVFYWTPVTPEGRPALTLWAELAINHSEAAPWEASDAEE